MINKKPVMHRNVSIRSLFVLLAAIVLSLCFCMNVQAKPAKTVYASNLSEPLWDFLFNEEISLNIVLDKDCTIDGIWLHFPDWEYEGDVKIIGNGYKLIVGNRGIDIEQSNLVIEDAVIEIDTSEKYSGRYYGGIYVGKFLTITRSNIEIHSNPTLPAINSGHIYTDENASITGYESDTYYSIRSYHPIDQVNVKVTEPKAGEKAVFEGSVDDNNNRNIQLTAGTLDDEKIRWFEWPKEYKETDNLTYEAGHTYRCVVNLSAKRGKVTAATKVKINGYDATFAEQKLDHAWFTYDFKIPAEDPASAPTARGAVPSSSGSRTVTVGKGIYTIQGQKAVLTAPVSKSIKNITIPAYVKANGKKYPVTKIAPKALSGLKKLTRATVGKNVKYIGTKAFYKCGKLKNLVIKTKKLTKKTVGANAFKGMNKKANVKCPKGKQKAYKKIFLKKGMRKSMKFK